MPTVEFPPFEETPERQKVFWYVYVPWCGQPQVKHLSFKWAKKEAQRIARKTGKETFILQAVKSFKVNDLLETNYMHEPEKYGKR